jgi:type I restriction enzyme S subunit
MAKYQKYAECKDSGVEWLGEIPSHWEMWKLSHAYNEIGSGTTPSTSNEENFEGDIPWVTTGELRENIILDTKKKVSQKTIELFPTLRKYPSGSVAIAMYGATIGRLGILGVEATTNQACCVMTTSKVLDNKYLFYWLQAFKNEIIQLSSGGGQPNINQEKVASLKISAPLVEDQVTIVNFLDHETAKIDSLISKQEKLIELLKEKRQAVISHAVTKGLDPNVTMKDSGVEWLGEVPEHWEISPIKFVLENKDYKRIPLSAEERGNRSGDYRYYGASGVIDYIDDYIFDEPNVLVGEDGANLVNRNTPLAFPAYGKYWVNNHAHILHPQDSLADYWAELIEIIDISPLVSGSAQPKLTAEALKNLKISFPLDLEERKAIDIFIKHQKVKFDFLISKATNQIELLKERRTALISSAVTGKIDVRNWQNPNNNNEAKMEFSA